MKKILFPTDFSETSKNAYLYALQFARKLDAEVITLHVYSLPTVDYIDVPAYLMEIYDTVELSNFENYKDEIPALRAIAEANNLNDIKVSNIMMSGDLITTILQMVKENNIDYVVMGTKGASGMKETFFGTSTAKIMTETRACVLGVPEEFRYQEIKKIAFTTRFSEKDFTALKRLLEVAKSFEAHVDCLFIKTPKAEVKDVVIADWKHLMKDEDVTFHMIASEQVEETILRFLEQHDSNLLALLNHNRGFFESLFHQNLTKKLAFHSKIPLLALHELK